MRHPLTVQEGIVSVIKVEDIVRDAQTYLYSRTVHSDTKNQFEDAGNKVRTWLKDNGETDAEGNLVYSFPSPVTIGDKTYKGVMLRRQQSPPSFDLDEVLVFAAGKNLTSLMVKQIPIVDDEGIYVCYQEGHITEEEVRSLLKYPKPTFALWPVEAREEIGDEE